MIRRIRFEGRDLMPIALLGIGQFGILIALLNYGLQDVSSGLGALVFASFPLMTMVVAAALRLERMTVANTGGHQERPDQARGTQAVAQKGQRRRVGLGDDITGRHHGRAHQYPHNAARQYGQQLLAPQSSRSQVSATRSTPNSWPGSSCTCSKPALAYRARAAVCTSLVHKVIF